MSQTLPEPPLTESEAVQLKVLEFKVHGVVGAYPHHAIVAMAAYPVCIEEFRQCAADPARDPDDRKRARLYLRWCFPTEAEPGGDA